MWRLAHLSDLHLGKNAETAARARQLVATLASESVDHVLVSGDITHRGRSTELGLFLDIFAPLLARQAVSLVPGNHDRLGDNAGEAMMGGQRVAIDTLPFATVVRLDSTAEYNRSLLTPHGEIDGFDLAAVSRALARARGLRVVMLHHHPLPMPEDNLIERVGGWLRITQGRSLVGGEALLEVLRGRCDLVLHGHRHVPRWCRVSDGGFDIYNAGSSTEMGAFRVFDSEDGKVVATHWQSASTPSHVLTPQ